MAKAVEIDETELLELRKLKGTIGKILSNPKGKLLVQEAHKLADPAAVTPEFDQLQVVQEPVKQLEQQLADLRKEREEEKRQAEHDAKIAALSRTIDDGLLKLKQQGWTEEGIAGVRKIMDERTITDPEVAAAYYEKQHPPAMPATPSSSGAWNFLEQPEDGSDAFLKGLLETRGESNVLLDRQIRDTLQGIRGARR
jgi:hypothetical protein